MGVVFLNLSHQTPFTIRKSRRLYLLCVTVFKIYHKMMTFGCSAYIHAIFIIFLRVLQVHGHDGWCFGLPPKPINTQSPQSSIPAATMETYTTMIMENITIEEPPVPDSGYRELICPVSRSGQPWTQLQSDTGSTTASIPKDDLLPNGFNWDELTGPVFSSNVQESSDSASYLFPRGRTVVSFSTTDDSGKMQTCTFNVHVNLIALLKAKSTSLLISWIPYQPASEYYVRYHPDYSDHDTQVEHVSSTISKIELTNLDTNTMYRIEIEAKNSTSSSVCTLDIAEMETLSAASSSRVTTALIIVCCILAILVIVLLILLCLVFCCFKRRQQITIDDTANGHVEHHNPGYLANDDNDKPQRSDIEHHNPGYLADDDNKPKRPLSQTSHAYVYISPEHSPTSKERPIELSASADFQK
ncbi:uncharacterized protein [Amphiura filiformis]|uniref:uncharacterized protein isoform X1 n=1 Tax=Amphiura filiformis TaxID=82378 RepID=UPI003B22700D